MAGRRKHAQLLADYLHEPVESACMVTRPGATARVTVGGLAGEAVGAGIARRGPGGSVKFDSNGWLAIGEDAFTLVRRDLRSNRPTGEPVIRIDYREVSEVVLSQGFFTTHADVSIFDGRTLAFETPRRGLHRPNRRVLEALAARCQATSAAAVAVMRTRSSCGDGIAPPGPE